MVIVAVRRLHPHPRQRLGLVRAHSAPPPDAPLELVGFDDVRKIDGEGHVIAGREGDLRVDKNPTITQIR